jgi:Zn-dependent alcohol dehydrogenase
MEIIGSDDHTKSELRDLIQFVESGRLNLSSSVTHRVQLEDVNTGLEIVERGIGNPIRVVVVK